MNEPFNIATAEDIRAGRVTDVYFTRGAEVIRSAGRDPQVVAEVRASSLPDKWAWAVLAGVDEVGSLLEGRQVEVEGLREGTLFHPEEPVMVLTGSYLAFSELETSLLGLLCQASGVATAAARCKLAAGDRPVYSFGARRMHPSIAPMIERAAFLGGCDGVSTLVGAEAIGMPPVGTMAHALILVLGEEEAWRRFDRVVDPRVPRVALVDTFQDEKFGAVAAATALDGRLAAVRIDTPASRRGNLPAILREVRWELDARGFSAVKLLVSGGVDERAILELNRYADAYGVGTAISNARVVDFSLDIVEVDGIPRAKRGKLSGRKHLWVCPECGNRGIAPAAIRLGHCPRCDHRVASAFESLVARGKVRGRRPTPRDIRDTVVEQVHAATNPFEDRDRRNRPG